MNTAIRCVVLLACVMICTSMTIRDCRCVKTVKIVNHALIVDVQVNKPSPYCNKKQVIVTLKDDSTWCLDPDEKFTKVIEGKKFQQALADAKKMNTTSPKTTTGSATASATITPTSP